MILIENMTRVTRLCRFFANNVVAILLRWNLFRVLVLHPFVSELRERIRVVIFIVSSCVILVYFTGLSDEAYSIEKTRCSLAICVRSVLPGPYVIASHNGRIRLRLLLLIFFVAESRVMAGVMVSYSLKLS